MGYNGNNIIVQPNLTDFDYWRPINAEIKYTLGYSGAPYLKDGLFDLFKAISILQKEDLNVNLNVIFTGLVETPKVKQYLSECQILAIIRPYTIQTQAGFPTKLGEYFATKRPVLATNFGDMEAYFTDGVDIIIAECENPESIALKIKWMLQNNRELASITERGLQ